MRTKMYYLGLQNIFVHSAIFLHTYVPTYSDLLNPAGGWGILRDCQQMTFVMLNRFCLLSKPPCS